MKIFLLIIFFGIHFFANAQQSTTSLNVPDSNRLAPSALPGKGLKQFDFFYAGENNPLSMYIIKNGKIVWTYTYPGKGEISDATLLADGSVLFAHQFGVTKINHDKKITWNYDAPAGCEIHTAEAIGKEHVVFIQNGNPAKLIVINTSTQNIEKQFDLPVAHPQSVHGQFRHARLTDKGTIIVGHMDMGKVSEYNVDGKELWSMPCQEPWSAIPLKNGNILVCSGSHKTVTEFSRNRDTVWKFSPTDLPGFTFSNIQLAVRLDNGNTIINNWDGKGNGTMVQAIEVDKNKKLLWALRSWDAPADLGRSTTIQLLDKQVKSKTFGYFK